jgi:hypothetical protein
MCGNSRIYRRMRAVWRKPKKGLPSLIYHEPALEVRFVRRAAGTTSYLTIRDSPINLGDRSNRST